MSRFLPRTRPVRIAAIYVCAYLFNVLAAFSQFGNAILGGDRDLSISGRTGRAYNEGKPWA